jgi:hypothetical protein
MLKEEADKKKKAYVAYMKAPKFLERDPSTTVFEEMIRVLYSVVVVNPEKNLKVKRLAVYQLFPKLVNLAESFSTPVHSSCFMHIMVGAMYVGWTEKTPRGK